MSNAFKQALEKTVAGEVSVTENGAIGFATAGNPLLDVNFAAASLRLLPEDAVEKMFAKAYYFDPVKAVEWLFMLRDVRGGMGERRSFRVCLKWLAKTAPDLAKALVPFVADYGRFDDLFCLVGEKEVEGAVFELVAAKWEDDIRAMNAGKPLSLLAKWMPSVNTSSKKTVALARRLREMLGLTEKTYRKTLSALRSALKVVERDASAGRWTDIDYSAVPSKANIKYKDAFLKHDNERRTEYLKSLIAGETKINSGACFPYDIVHSYAAACPYGGIRPDDAVEAMWKSLPDYVDDGGGSCIVVADGSGSMSCSIGGSSVTALEVAESLAVYFSERLTGPFKNKYITFSARPQYVDFGSARSLAGKLNLMRMHYECENTDINAVFDLLLTTARRAGLAQSDIPSTVLVVSDMEFDAGVECMVDGEYSAPDSSLFANISKKWAAAGYKLPRLVFWNVNSRTMTVPVQTNKNGVALVSGFSPAVSKMVFSGRTNPYEALLDAISSERYSRIGAVVEKTLNV